MRRFGWTCISEKTFGSTWRVNGSVGWRWWKKGEWVWTDWKSDSCREWGREEPWEIPKSYWIVCYLLFNFCSLPPILHDNPWLLHLLAGWCASWFPCVSPENVQWTNCSGLIPVAGNYFNYFQALVDFQVRALVVYFVFLFLWVRKFAIWSNVVKNRTLNLCMVQEGKLFFPLQHWRRGGGCSENKREIETETNFLLHRTDYKEIQKKTLEC